MISMLDYSTVVTGGATKQRTSKKGRPDNVSLKGLTTTTSECAESTEIGIGKPCASKKIINIVEQYADAFDADAADPRVTGMLPRGGGDAAVIRRAANTMDCDSESCVLSHPSLLKFVVSKKIAPASIIERELETRFKAKGPRNSTALLSNYNIDETLQKWAHVYTDFYPCPFAMMDFDTNGDVFGNIDICDVLNGIAHVDLGPAHGRVKRPSKCFGCVVNTDVSSGPGKHWVAVMVDCRPDDDWHVEYFNSTGRPPPMAIVHWMEKTRNCLVKYRAKNSHTAPCGVKTIAVTNVDHQESQTECGMYALFYIRRRLENTPHTFFFGDRIPDNAMTEFRTHVFRSA